VQKIIKVDDTAGDRLLLKITMESSTIPQLIVSKLPLAKQQFQSISSF
jgi:hypothetical protein